MVLDTIRSRPYQAHQQARDEHLQARGQAANALYLF